jgi:hypothetical protein
MLRCPYANGGGGNLSMGIERPRFFAPKVANAPVAARSNPLVLHVEIPTRAQRFVRDYFSSRNVVQLLPEKRLHGVGHGFDGQAGEQRADCWRFVPPPRDLGRKRRISRVFGQNRGVARTPPCFRRSGPASPPSPRTGHRRLGARRYRELQNVTQNPAQTSRYHEKVYDF